MLSFSHKLYALALSTIHEPQSFVDAARNPDWCKAMDTKYQALVSSNTWSVVPLPVIRLMWLANGFSRLNLIQMVLKKGKKARRVTKGFTQQVGLDYEEIFSPVAKLVTMKTLIVVVAQRQWYLHQLDINRFSSWWTGRRSVYVDVPRLWTAGSEWWKVSLQIKISPFMALSRHQNNGTPSCLLILLLKVSSSWNLTTLYSAKRKAANSQWFSSM